LIGKMDWMRVDLFLTTPMLQLLVVVEHLLPFNCFELK